VSLHFTPIEGKNKAKCDICSNKYSHSCGSTSNLALHLKTKHSSVEVKALKQPRTTEPIVASASSDDTARTTVGFDQPHETAANVSNVQSPANQQPTNTVADSQKSAAVAASKKQSRCHHLLRGQRPSFAKSDSTSCQWRRQADARDAFASTFFCKMLQQSC
jgi:hypothetical protein